ncbi:MAG TPA: heparan N-sulfatase, partial [Pirellula sp.]|nr:heparan N-sulfatase [Pirellula sp.]
IRNLHPEFKFSSHVMRPAKEEAAYWPSWVEKAKTDESAQEIIRAYTQRDAEELYDLKNDPQEQHNLASDQEHVNRLVRMRHDLTSWMTEQGDTETVFGAPELLPTETP